MCVHLLLRVDGALFEVCPEVDVLVLACSCWWRGCIKLCICCLHVVDVIFVTCHLTKRWTRRSARLPCVNSLFALTDWSRGTAAFDHAFFAPCSLDDRAPQNTAARCQLKSEPSVLCKRLRIQMMLAELDRQLAAYSALRQAGAFAGLTVRPSRDTPSLKTDAHLLVLLPQPQQAPFAIRLIALALCCSIFGIPLSLVLRHLLTIPLPVNIPALLGKDVQATVSAHCAAISRCRKADVLAGPLGHFERGHSELSSIAFRARKKSRR